MHEAENVRAEQAPEITALSVSAAPAEVGTASAAISPQNIASHSEKDRLLPLDITVNSAPTGQWLLLERNGVLYASEDAFKNWRLQREKDIQTIQAHKITWLALSLLPGFQAKFNDENQSVILTFANNAFMPTTVESEPQALLKVMPASLAAFANYDLSFTGSHVQSDSGSSSKNIGGLFDFGVSGNLGVFSSSYIGQNLMGLDGTTQKSVRRLETVFNRDYPDSNITLRLGDSTTHVDVFNNSMNFAGFQLVRNFALRPGFVTQPIPSLKGASTTPSSVDLYVNEVLRQTTNVPAGPFTLDNLPLLTDSGDIRLVVTDALGRQTVITQPFFTNSNLLEQGLSDWGVQVGWVRKNMGIYNADYGPGFASAQWRQGMSKLLTAQAGIDLSSSTKRLSAGVNYALPFQALGTLNVAGSQDRNTGTGEKWSLGLEKITPQHNFTLSAQGADRNYRELGWDSSTLPNRMQLSASYGYNSSRFGTAGVAFARINTFNQGNLNTFSANYSMRIGERGTLSFTATRVTGKTSGTSIGISLFFPLEKSVTLAASATQSNSNVDTYVSVSRPLTTEVGSGWRALSGTRSGSAYSEGGYYYQGNKGQLSADASASSTQQTVRLGAKGSLVVMGGNFFASRTIQNNSFALVDVPGYANVGLSFQGNSRGYTNKEGKAFLTGLQPYQENHIQLDPKTLPLNAAFDNLEQIVVPSANTGVKVVFPVNQGRTALIQIILDEDKQAAPIGAEIELLGTNKTFFVARKGLAFVTDLQANNHLRMKWRDKACDLAIAMPVEKQDDITRIGPVMCMGVTR